MESLTRPMPLKANCFSGSLPEVSRHTATTQTSQKTCANERRPQYIQTLGTREFFAGTKETVLFAAPDTCIKSPHLGFSEKHLSKKSSGIVPIYPSLLSPHIPSVMRNHFIAKPPVYGHSNSGDLAEIMFVPKRSTTVALAPNRHDKRLLTRWHVVSLSKAGNGSKITQQFQTFCPVSVLGLRQMLLQSLRRSCRQWPPVQNCRFKSSTS